MVAYEITIFILIYYLLAHNMLYNIKKFSLLASSESQDNLMVWS